MAIEQINPLLARLEALEAELKELKSSAPAAPPDPEPERPVSRRRLMGMAGAAAAGAVGASVLANTPAGAADAGPVIQGQFNNATNATNLAATVSNDAVFIAVAGPLSGTGDGLKGWANGATAGVGVVGLSTNGEGVNGTSNAGNLGVGVRGVAATGFDSIGVVGQAAAGLGLYGVGGRAQLYLSPNGTVGAPTTGLHAKGEFFVDTNGVLFYNTANGTPGTWTQLNDQSGAGGGLTVLPAPSRVYDSRVGQANPSGSPQGTLAFNATARTINCSPAVPSGATAILCNLAVTGTAGPGAGALLMWAAGATQPVASSINWSSAGLTLANAVTSGCNASQDVQVRCVASTGSSTNFIIDVVGYYL